MAHHVVYVGHRGSSCCIGGASWLSGSERDCKREIARRFNPAAGLTLL